MSKAFLALGIAGGADADDGDHADDGRAMILLDDQPQSALQPEAICLEGYLANANVSRRRKRMTRQVQGRNGQNTVGAQRRMGDAPSEVAALFRPPRGSPPPPSQPGTANVG